VWANAIIKAEVAADPSAGLGHRRVGVEVDLLIFHRAPEALHKHIVAPAALAVHADRNLLALEDAGEVDAGELAALIGVEDFRFPKRASASSKASMQKSAARVIDTRQASTRRLNQSTMATR
jgi:hypothetical protein